MIGTMVPSHFAVDSQAGMAYDGLPHQHPYSNTAVGMHAGQYVNPINLSSTKPIHYPHYTAALNQQAAAPSLTDFSNGSSAYMHGNYYNTSGRQISKIFFMVLYSKVRGMMNKTIKTCVV
jgi:hypothetical protein